MRGSLHRRFWVLLISAATAWGCWKTVPGTGLDRAAFTSVVSGFANPPFFISGNGTHASPWKLASLTEKPKLDPRQAPVIVSMGDDLEGFFQSSPPAPIDIAVVFNNFQRLGAKKAATAAVLSWETPDPIGLAALDKALSRFDSLVMAAPLSRGSTASPIPPGFRRASVPLLSIVGDTSALPVVNRIPVPGIILGGENSVAGFSVLESESAGRLAPLMARWEDRVVFAFPLLTVLQRNHFPIEKIEVRLGEYIKLSPTGPIVPLDSFGRLAIPLKATAPYKEISAEALIDGGDDLFPKTAPDPVILRDDRTSAESSTRAFSRNLSAMVAAIASDEGFSHSTAYQRLPIEWELRILAAIVVVLTLFCGLTEFKRHITFAVIAAVLLSALWIGAGIASVWLPMISALAAVVAAVVISKLIPRSKPRPVVVAPIPNELPPEPPVFVAPEPEPPTPKKPRIPAKKAPAKKAAKKITRTKKPPSES